MNSDKFYDGVFMNMIRFSGTPIRDRYLILKSWCGVPTYDWIYSKEEFEQYIKINGYRHRIIHIIEGEQID
jgi:hypothetical protein